MDDYNNEEIDPQSEYLFYQVKRDDGNEQLVEPFLKIRTMHSLRDIGLSTWEWFFNRKGYMRMFEGFLLVGFYALVWWELRFLFWYFIGGGIIGAMIAVVLGYIFSRRDMAGIITWMVEGHKTYLHAVMEEMKTVLPKLRYVQADITAFFMQKAPSHIINQGKLRPGVRGIQILQATHYRFMGSDYYFNNWKDRTNHVYIGGPFSLSAFMVGIATLDKRVTKYSRRYEKILKKAHTLVQKEMSKHPDIDMDHLDESEEARKTYHKGLPKALKVLEMDRRLAKDIAVISQDVRDIESVIHTNPLQIEIRKLNKYTRRFMIAAATYNMNEELKKTRTDVVPLDSLKDRFNAASAVSKFYEILPQYMTRARREFYWSVYGMLQDFTSSGVQTMTEAKKLVRKRLDSMIETKQVEKPTPRIEVKD